MRWWGKLLGGTLGFIFGEGIFPILLGLLLGHILERKLKGVDLRSFRRRSKEDSEKIQSAFFTASYSMIGHVAKAGGQVSRLEIVVVQDIMKEMRLNPKQKKVAIQLFEQGKKADFPVDDVLQQFKKMCYHRNNLVQMFLEVLSVTALADGRLAEPQSRILRKSAKLLGYSTKEYQALLRQMRTHNPYKQRKRALLGYDAKELNKAYDLLGVTELDEDSVLKKAYRRQMNLHHPDKLIAKGVTQDAMEVANQKVQEIKSAYDFIKSSRKSSVL